MTLPFATAIEADAASNTKKMSTFKIIARGNTAYVVVYSGIYKVDLISRKSTRLEYGGPSSFPVNMKKKGNYLYYSYMSMIGEQLMRVNIYTGKTQYLTQPGIDSYVISGNKIYYGSVGRHKVMKLNGKSKKLTKIKTKNVAKMANKPG